MELIEFVNKYGSFFQVCVVVLGFSIAFFQLKALNRQIVGNTLQQLQTNDREIKALRLTYPFLFGPSEKLKEDQIKQVKWYMNILVNHIKHIHIQHRMKTIPDEYWDAVDRDMKDSVANPNFREACERVRSYVPESFKRYIDSLI